MIEAQSGRERGRSKEEGWGSLGGKGGRGDRGEL